MVYPASGTESLNEAIVNGCLRLVSAATSFCRGGLAGIVGISKAVLILTEGRIGPAFDKNVVDNLQADKITDPSSWIYFLKKVSQDIHDFEKKNDCLLSDAVPSMYSNLPHGQALWHDLLVIDINLADILPAWP